MGSSVPVYLRSRLVNDVERSFCCAAEAAEARFGNNFADARFSSLCAQTQPDFLRTRAGRAQQRGERVVHASDWIQIVLQIVFSIRLDDHPCAVFCQRLAHIRGRADRIAHVVQAVEESYEIVVLAWEFFCLAYLEADAISDSFALRRFACGVDRAGVIVKAIEA